MPTEHDIAGAREALREAEGRLKAIAAEAVEAERYATGASVTAAALQVAKLAESLEEVAERLREEGAEAVDRVTRRARRRRYSGRPGYPKFMRCGDDVVRVGWSRRLKTDYRHRAPLRLALPLARDVAELATDGRVVPSDDFFPLHDPEDAAEAPTYQAYLVLGWLVHLGMLEKHGRRGYTMADAGNLDGRIDAAWQELPHR